jgi:hypothetical protein
MTHGGRGAFSRAVAVTLQNIGVRKTYIALNRFAVGNAVVLIADLGSGSTKSRCVGLLQRMCKGECVNLHAGVENLPHDRIGLKVATV